MVTPLYKAPTGADHDGDVVDSNESRTALQSCTLRLEPVLSKIPETIWNQPGECVDLTGLAFGAPSGGGYAVLGVLGREAAESGLQRVLAWARSFVVQPGRVAVLKTAAERGTIGLGDMAELARIAEAGGPDAKAAVDVLKEVVLHEKKLNTYPEAVHLLIGLRTDLDLGATALQQILLAPVAEPWAQLFVIKRVVALNHPKVTSILEASAKGSVHQAVRDAAKAALDLIKKSSSSASR